MNYEGVTWAALAAMVSGCSTQPIPTEELERPEAIIAYGDSITRGGNDQGGFSHDGYAWVLAERLGVPLTNNAVGGSQLGDATQIGLIRQDTRPLTTYALLLTGFNDVLLHRDEPSHLPRYVALLDEAITKLTEDGRTLILGDCLGYNRAEALSRFGRSLDETTAVYNAAIYDAFWRHKAKGERIFMVRVSKAYDPNTTVFDDRIHPSAYGHKVIADYFTGVLFRGVMR